MPKIKIEHIDALSRGEKSGIKIGSRGVPHHLYSYERDEYERAMKRGYLIVDHTSRVNLENLWMLVSQVRNRECLILSRYHGNARVTSNQHTLFEGTLAEAKAYIAGYAHTHHLQ